MHLRARAVWLVLLVGVLVGCQASPGPAPRASASPPSRSAGELAAEALVRGDYADAAELYQTAIREAPGQMPLHYGLGVAATYLERRPDAIREFTWVLAHGDPASDEVRSARGWLRSAGALPGEAGETTAHEPEPDRDAAAKVAPAALHGRVTFGENPGDVAPMKRMLLFLHDYPSRVVYFRIRTDEEGRFHFSNVPPGVYMLTDRAAGPPRWRLRVQVKAGDDVTLNLEPANSTRIRDDFPNVS